MGSRFRQPPDLVQDDLKQVTVLVYRLRIGMPG